MNEVNNEPKGIPAWLSITITLGLVFSARAIAGDAGMWLIIFACSIWMWTDAKKRDLTKLTGIAAIKKPFVWFICGVGLFVISFPVYLTKVFKTEKLLANSIKVSIVSVTAVAFLAMLYFAGKAASYVFNPTSNHWLTELKPLLLTDIDSFYCPENFTTLKLDVKSSSLVTYEKTCNKNDNTGYMAIGADEKKRIVQIQHILISKNTDCTSTNLGPCPQFS